MMLIMWTVLYIYKAITFIIERQQYSAIISICNILVHTLLMFAIETTCYKLMVPINIFILATITLKLIVTLTKSTQIKYFEITSLIFIVMRGIQFNLLIIDNINRNLAFLPTLTIGCLAGIILVCSMTLIFKYTFCTLILHHPQNECITIDIWGFLISADVCSFYYQKTQYTYTSYLFIDYSANSQHSLYIYSYIK